MDIEDRDVKLSPDLIYRSHRLAKLYKLDEKYSSKKYDLMSRHQKMILDVVERGMSLLEAQADQKDIGKD